MVTFSPDTQEQVPEHTRPDEPVRGGEPAGFEEYVAARGAALVRFAILLTGDDHRAEDLVQEALAKAYLRWDRISRSDRPDPYLRRMLVNASRSWWRRRTNRELPVDQPADRQADRPDIGADLAERDALWRLVARLPYRQRAVLVLRYYEDLDNAAIAEILQCTPTTVRTHAMRGLNLLRKYYGASATRPEARNES